MNVPPRPSARPLVVAHRGASDEEPEHTLRAYRKAFDHGADGVECDVRLTADHHLVCVHDRRVERTSNGAGVVSTLELARLEELDWASWKRGPGETETPEADPERGHLLTLRRLLDTLVATGEEVVTLIETKHPTRHGDDVEKTLVQVLRHFDLDRGDQPGRPHVRVMSFSARALQRVHKLSPAVPLVHLVEGIVPAMAIDGTLPKGIGAVGLDVRLVRRKPQVVERFRRHGHRVYVWTVDEERDMDLCCDLGVDVVITNRPGVAIDRMGVTG
ncbi:glycerophosphodiester phosphodiesterase family protein [Phycicoccus sonneratiae]|uniref:Glycerophosphodiester phosphodiesterase n=1 Tax=Phycicoccus sonneratiae TaxID=2807628 RepID=A0ABS2CPC7_9MICO|nr:glycerophosphodiester phosphodiesterase family protein [Phycicoccus sonneraticus]MBM6401731.1 glycerophosphodiester phosphodiesterase [Phycicoccus sonneraticus]